MKKAMTTISIYLNTWKNYNENGADGGEWVNLPCDLDEVKERIVECTGENPDQAEWFINDAEVNINGLEIDEYSDIDKLNESAEQLKQLDEYELEKLEAILEVYEDDLTGAIENIDNYTYYSGQTLEDVAYQIIEECYELPEIAQRYFDYKAFARDLSYDGYTETNNGVICQ